MEIKSIAVTFNLSGLLFESKGYSGHRQPTIVIDPHTPKASFTGLGDLPGELWKYLPHKTWIEDAAGSVKQSRSNPRLAFARDTNGSKWDDMRLLYFTSYAMWNYLTAPFCFKLPGFTTREVQSHTENGERWRVLEVLFPTDIPTHNKIQRFYYNEQFLLKRIDYAPDVLPGSNASQYVLDYKEAGGLMFPTLRRVVPKAPSGIFGPRLVLMDFCNIVVT